MANYEYDENGELVDKKGGLSGGNNQESSSEAINAWASLILWGEAVGNTTIRDAGIYMYTTEIAAIEDYYYDVHNEIFTENIKMQVIIIFRQLQDYLVVAMIIQHGGQKTLLK